MTYTEALERTRDTRRALIGRDASLESPGMFTSLFGRSTATIVADLNTWKAAGERVYKAFIENGISCNEPVIFKDPDFYAEWTFVNELEQRLGATDTVAVAVGSGVINDITKLVSGHLERRYMVVGTAASMDGYSSYGASITKDGNKQTFDCPAPAGVIFDSTVAAAAPKELAASGYADLLAKIPAGAEWVIASCLGKEKTDDFAFSLVQDKLWESLSEPDKARLGDIEVTEKLGEGLILSGFAMQEMLSSRPASGTEHQFSHYWDMENLSVGGRHVSHGFKVAVGTLVSTAMLEFLLKYDFTSLDIEKCLREWPSWEEQQTTIRALFKNKPAHLARALDESAKKYTPEDELRKELTQLTRIWPQLKEKITPTVMPFDKVRDCLKRVCAPYEPYMIGVTNEKLRETFRGIPYMRSRYNAIDIVLRCGLMDSLEEYLFGTKGIWPVQK